MPQNLIEFRVYNMHSIIDMEGNPNEDWVQVPQSKNSFGAFLKLGSACNLIQYGKLRQKTNLFVYERYSLKDMKEDLKGDLVKVPSLKIAFGGVFEVGSSSHPIQHVKLCTCANFHACIIKCTIRPIFEVKRLHYRICFLKRSFSVCTCIDHTDFLFCNIITYIPFFRLYVIKWE